MIGSAVCLSACGSSSSQATAAKSPVNTANFTACWAFVHAFDLLPKRGPSIQSQFQDFVHMAITQGMKAPNEAVRLDATKLNVALQQRDGPGFQHAFVNFGVACHKLKLGPGDI